MFQELREAEAQPAAARRHVSFALSDGEINDYMRYALRTTPRSGLDSSDRKSFPTTTFPPLRRSISMLSSAGGREPSPAVLRPILHSKQSIWVDYRFAAANSKVTFSVEKAYYDKLRLPSFFVEKMIQIVAARQPEHYDTSKRLLLPFSLRNVWTENQVVKGNN